MVEDHSEHTTQFYRKYLYMSFLMVSGLSSRSLLWLNCGIILITRKIWRTDDTIFTFYTLCIKYWIYKFSVMLCQGIFSIFSCWKWKIISFTCDNPVFSESIRWAFIGIIQNQIRQRSFKFKSKLWPKNKETIAINWNCYGIIWQQLALFVFFWHWTRVSSSDFSSCRNIEIKFL